MSFHGALFVQTLSFIPGLVFQKLEPRHETGCDSRKIRLQRAVHCHGFYPDRFEAFHERRPQVAGCLGQAVMPLGASQSGTICLCRCQQFSSCGVFQRPNVRALRSKGSQT